jgi:hypothetical protein
MSTKVSGYELKGTMVQVTGEVDGQPVTAAGPSYGVTKAKSPAHMQRYLETLLVNRHAMAPTEFKPADLPEKIEEFHEAHPLPPLQIVAGGTIGEDKDNLGRGTFEVFNAIRDLHQRTEKLEALSRRGFWGRLLWLLFGK